MKPVPLPHDFEIKTTETDLNHGFASDGNGRMKPTHLAEATGLTGSLIVNTFAEATDPTVIYLIDPLF
jgi:hypothetical protein